jgi:hypothetical protein
MLGLRRERLGNHCATEKADELAPSHCRAPEALNRDIVAVELRAVKGCPVS